MKFINGKYNRLRVYKVTKIPIRILIQKQIAEINEQRLKSFGRTNSLTTNQSKSILLQLLDIGFDRFLKYRYWRQQRLQANSTDYSAYKYFP